MYSCVKLGVSHKENNTGLYRVSKNKLLVTIHGSKRQEITGGWRKLHSKELS